MVAVTVAVMTGSISAFYSHILVALVSSLQTASWVKTISKACIINWTLTEFYNVRPFHTAMEAALYLHLHLYASDAAVGVMWG